MSTTKEKKTMQQKTNDTNVNETILNVPLSAIFADYEWNVRSRAEVEKDTADAVKDGKADAGFGLKAFADTFHRGGQDTPVVLAEVKGGKTLTGKKTDKRYELVAGFRRFTAVSLLNSADEVAKRKEAGDTSPAVANVPDGCLRGVVRVFANAFEARSLNARENTLRSNLNQADLVRLVREFVLTHNQTQVATSEALGITQGYVAKLAKIATLPDAVLNHWREGQAIPGHETLPTTWKQLTNADMLDLAGAAKDMAPQEVVAKYVELLGGEKPEADHETKGAAAEQKIREKLDDIGSFLGQLAAAGVIERGTMAFESVLGPSKAGYLLNSGPKDPDREKRQALADVVRVAWEREVKKAKKSKEKSSPVATD